jgi:glucosamine--fructose-6-phosphate aminotransferase (isomerizing)
MAIAFGRTRRLSAGAGSEMVRALRSLPQMVTQVLAQADTIRAIAERYAAAQGFFYVGRGYMYPSALEGALKLKEISYIHAEGYHAAELKHGPIALLGPDFPVMALAPDIDGKGKTLANIQECRARRAPVVVIATEGDSDVDALYTDVIRIPRCASFLSPIPAVVAQQLFAYYVADLRGCPIDQPRNLAKSVTVE